MHPSHSPFGAGERILGEEEVAWEGGAIAPLGGIGVRAGCVSYRGMQARMPAVEAFEPTF
jgi:hypothetical protein